MDKVKFRDKVMLMDKLVNSNLHMQTKELWCKGQSLGTHPWRTQFSQASSSAVDGSAAPSSDG
eukprot:864079-Prorocentrum_lima.AAC.1